MAITVKSLLQMSALETAQVVAGYEKLENVVKGVTIIEAPDIANWLSGGELLLTSLYAGLSEGLNYREFIQKLAEKEVSALAIKTRRFIQSIPQEITEAANEFGLPIIELDASVRFVDIMYPVMEQLFNSQVVKLKYYKEIQERFTTLALECEGLEGIIRILETLVGNPVAVYDSSNRCLKTTDPRLEVFKECQERVDRETLNEKFSCYRQIVNFPALGEGSVPQVVVQIKAFGQVKSYLTVAELNKPLQEMDFICLEQAATVVTLDSVKRFAVSEVEQKFRNDLIEQILTGELKSANALERASFMDWDLNRSYRVVVFDLQNLDAHLAENRNKNKMALQSLKSELTSTIANAIRVHTRDFIIGNKVDTVVVFWPVTEKPETLLTRIKTVGQEVQGQVKRRMKKIAIQVGIGDEATGLEDIPRSYKEAQDALTYGSMLHTENQVVAFSELGVFRILCKFAERNSLEEFLPKSLIKLLNYDRENESELLNTLTLFLECNGNASKAAKELFIHYKTILYRIERIKEVTGLNLEDNKSRLELEIGLKMLHLIKNT